MEISSTAYTIKPDGSLAYSTNEGRDWNIVNEQEFLTLVAMAATLGWSPLVNRLPSETIAALSRLQE